MGIINKITKYSWFHILGALKNGWDFLKLFYTDKILKLIN